MRNRTVPVLCLALGAWAQVNRPVAIPVSPACSGTFAFLDDFSATSWLDASPRTGNAPNYFGGYWYALSDTTSDSGRLDDPRVGRSTITIPTGKRSWMPDLNQGVATVTATLEKSVPTSKIAYHNLAGWAKLGTDLTDVNGLPQDFGAFGSGSLTAIGFDLYAGASLSKVVSGAAFDTNLVKQITMKLHKASVPDSVAYQIDIAAKKAVTGRTGAGDGLPDLCVDLPMLAQPSGYASKQGAAVSFVPNDLTEISWEIRIEDQADPAKHSSGPNTFGVTNIKFYGISKADIPFSWVEPYWDCSRSVCVLVYPSKNRRDQSAARAHAASYHSGLVLSYSVAGPSALIEVRNLSGTRVASFQRGAKARNLSLPVSLSRGTYVVSVQGSGARQTALLNVAR